jgi:N6-adenosine-specific RNA methylase IME4
VYNDIKKQEQRDNKIETPPLPQGKYRCIVIDPPWPIEKIDRDVRPNQSRLDYPTMSLEDIAKLPISDFASEDGCHLYLWVTQKFLPTGLALLETWNFTYQCVLTWVKPTGMTPYSWMYNTEHVLFATRDGLRLQEYGLKLSFDAPKNGHSTKPDIFYDRVMRASPEPRLEMFARHNRNGFVVWGNEVL